MGRNLVIFNLSTDLNNPVLATAHLWIHGFSSFAENVTVYSTHVGEFDLPENVKIIEIGGGNFSRRVIAVKILLFAAIQLLTEGKDFVVFHHQSPRTAVFPGILFKLFKKRQALWYSHSSSPISFRIGSATVDFLVSSHSLSLPKNTHETIYTGHGIDTSFGSKNQKRGSGTILFLGRIAPIKQIDKLITAVADNVNQKLEINLTGNPSGSGNYLSEILKLAEQRNVKIHHYPAIHHNQVFKYLSQFDYFYSGMQKSVDKSAIEAAVSGCFVLTIDSATQDLTGMAKFWKENSPSAVKDLSAQINYLQSLNHVQKTKSRSEISEYAKSKNDYRETTRKIWKHLESGNQE